MKGDFTVKVKNTLSKRAGERCSICGDGTSKPHSDKTKFLNLGEAAHIKGNKPSKSNRYDPSMSDSERCDISNGIWLCLACHKEVDTDDTKFTVEVLTKAKLDHEHRIENDLYNQQSIIVDSEKILHHDRKIFQASEAIFNERRLDSFLKQLSENRFIFWEDENLLCLNGYLEFHNQESNQFLTPELKKAYSDFLSAMNTLRLALYSVDEKDKRFDWFYNYLPGKFFIGMQSPPEDAILGVGLYDPRQYNSFKSNYEKFARELDSHIAYIKKEFAKYRQLIKTILIV